MKKNQYPCIILTCCRACKYLLTDEGIQLCCHPDIIRKTKGFEEIDWKKTKTDEEFPSFCPLEDAE